MIYDYIIEHYKEAEPIFFSDILIEGVSKPALNQQLKTLCKKELLAKFDNGVYYIPKKSQLNSTIGPNADMVARYRFISRGDRVDGFYAGNSFANQIGISTQVPQVVEIVTNNTGSTAREVEIGKRRFYVRKSIAPVTKENVHVLQILELLGKLDIYLDGTYQDAKCKFRDYIELHDIRKADVDKYIRLFPGSVFKYYYELELEHVLA